MLKFQKGNAKLDAFPGKKIYTFSILSGWACPFAKECLSKAVVTDEGKRKIEDGKHTQFRCFSASQEAQYSNVYEARKHNFDILRDLRTVEALADRIEADLPKKAKLLRVHVAGDFFNQRYFDAWNEVALRNPDRIFYAYTKSLQYWVNRLDSIADNFVLTASFGGRLDHLISEHGLRFAKVVYTEQEAAEAGLEIDHDESHAVVNGPSFALLLHGTQPKGSDAGEALKALKKQGKGGYSKKGKE